MFRKSFGIKRNGRDDTRESVSPDSLDQSPSPSAPDTIAAAIDEEFLLSQATLSINSEAEDSGRTRKNSDVDSGPLGLNIVYAPESGHSSDIIFVHGLGGTSRLTWSKDRNLALFWPLTFLSLEPDVCSARIFTFGYNSDFRKSGNVSTSVLDFAKDLLFDLRYGKDGQTQDLNVGNVPIIFVVHSMGGLLVKEAYMQGQNDPDYESIIKAISAIIFLATPHRGTNLAETLNLILKSSLVTNQKHYVSELSKSSFTLQKLNEQFRHIAPKLDIVSFYETQPCSIGFKRVRVVCALTRQNGSRNCLANSRKMVLDKESSVLGYPGEISKALNADHHNVCKFDSPQDPNYISVRNVLKSLVSKIIRTSKHGKARPLTAIEFRGTKEHGNMRSLLAITRTPDADYIFFRDQWTPGTSEWILETREYVEWHHSPSMKPRILWMFGGPGAGKSVLSSFIVNTLVEQGHCCQYFFVRLGDEKKRTLSTLLRSIAYQLTQTIPEFAQRVNALVDEAIDFATAGTRMIWEQIFKTILFDMELDQPIYWIIDGIDEADDPKAFIKLLSDLVSCSIPVRLLFVSQHTSEISTSIERIPKVLEVVSRKIDGNVDDLRSYISRELSMSGDPDFKQKITGRIISGAENNFLWVRLAVQKLNTCHTHADVELALRQLPVGMEPLYDRMATTIVQNPSPTDRTLAIAILQHVTCSLRVLKLAELSAALNERASELIDLQKSIRDLCGGFLIIDNGGHVAMVHQTAREYLTSNASTRPFHVDRSIAHEQIFLSCMRCLMTVGLRSKINRNQTPEYLDYAAKRWSSHLNSAPAGSVQVEEVLKEFLTRHWVLTWIQLLANGNQLRVLVHASKHLTRYSARRKEYCEAREATSGDFIQQELIESWAVDFIKIVGKFGSILLRNPDAIYKTIPPFCPRNSSVYQFFGKAESRNLNITGLSNDNWDDAVARISLGSSAYATSIFAAGNHISILTSTGLVYIFDSSTFQETATSPIKHGERLYRIVMNSTGTLLVTYGYRTIKVWEMSSGICTVSAKNVESRPRPLTMLLKEGRSTLTVGFDDRRVRMLDLAQPSPSWQLVAELEEPELEGHILNSSNHMAMSKDGSLIAVAYRGHPLSAWEVDGPMHLGHCWRSREEGARGDVIEAMWHPLHPEVIGLYIEGVVFKWRPYDNEVDEISTGASRLAISGDGSLFATGDVHGTVKVHTTSDFGLLYQLASSETVLGLTFSPDLRRFYDIRGHYGNAWEPNALMKFVEQSEKAVESESQISSNRMGMGWSQRVDSITVLGVAHTNHLYCYGTETGTVSLHHIQRGKIGDIHTSKGYLSIEQISWSSDGQHLCFSDSGKKVSIMKVFSGAPDSDPAVELIAEVPTKNITDGPVLQLLFHPDSSRLLIYTFSTICVISLASATVIHSQEIGNMDKTVFKWAVHPQDTSLIVAISTNAARTLDWNLKTIQACHLQYPRAHAAQTQDVIDSILCTRDGRNLLVQLSSAGRNAKEKEIFSIESASLLLPTKTPTDSDEAVDLITMQPSPLPEEVSRRAALILSASSTDRLIFISRTFSVCSWQGGPIPNYLPQAGASSSSSLDVPNKSSRTSGLKDVISPVKGSFKELFSLPGDWVNWDSLPLCKIWGREKSLLCPRNGEVAVVRCAALI